MSDEPSSREVAFDSAAFEEWVEKTAESKNLSRGEVLDQMLSSYWILEELTGMMDEAGQGTPASRFEGTATGDGRDGDVPSAATTEGEADTREEPSARSEQNEDLSELIREFQELRSAILEMPDQQETGHPAEPARPQWEKPRRSPSPPQRADDGLRTTLSDLQDRVEDLSAALSDVQDRHEEDVAALEADIEKTLDTLDTLESSVDDLVDHSELESLAVTLEEELSRIEETTAELEGRLTQIEEAHAETAREVADFADGQSELEARLDREFDSIENLFQHLLDRTDGVKARVEAVSDSHEEDMAPVEDDIADRERLTAIMREAHLKDISTAVCDSCETKVNLQLLHAPYCPECDRSISGLESGGWLPFDSATLETEPIQSASDGLDGDTGDPSDLLETPPDDGPHT